MKKLSLVATVSIMLALLFTLASPSLIMASPYRILNPSFETPDTAPSIANWAFSEVGDNDYEGAQAESPEWVTQGTYSYKISIPAKNITMDAYAQILQSVNFNPIDTISFDANLQADTALEFEARVLVGTTTVWGPQAVPTVATPYLHQEVDVSSITTQEDLIFRIVDLTGAKSATISCYFDNIRIWGSYSDEVARTTVSNNFANYGDSVYMYGENIAVAVDTYKVAYYDGDGYKMGTDVVFDITVPPTDGVLQSEIRPADYEGAGAGFGTWHAVVYNTTGSMPASYAAVSKADSGYIITDSFYVEESCIPEFPTVIGGIGVAGLCFGIYYWKRKRKHDSKG